MLFFNRYEISFIHTYIYIYLFIYSLYIYPNNSWKESKNAPTKVFDLENTIFHQISNMIISTNKFIISIHFISTGFAILWNPY